MTAVRTTGGRVSVVVCSPRVPAGLLSWPAWQALRSGAVLVRDADHPQAAAVRASGVDVEVVTGLDAGDLSQRAVAGGHVVLLSAGAADAGLVRELGLAAARGGVPVEVLHGSYDPPGARLLDVVAVMDRLRSPGGCPWDAEQTHTSLMPYLVEEAYEAYQALEDGDLHDLREELGDVLLQVVFHARVASERPTADGGWDVDDVAADLVDKLVRRHPHVFADPGGAKTTAGDLEASWEALKQAEKGRASVTDGVPLSQPALLLAAKLQRRAARLGVPTLSPTEQEGPGLELWRLVATCREQGVDPEVALRTTARAFRDRLAALEADLSAEGVDPSDLDPDDWRQRWTSSVS